MALEPDSLAAFRTAPTDRNRHIGRVVREIVDRHLNHGDGSGEREARLALYALSDKLDPGHRKALAEVDKLDGTEPPCVQ